MMKAATRTLLFALAGFAAAGPLTSPARADEGAAVFKKYCSICHSTEAGKNKIGPSLDGVVGRKSGSEPGFNYSAAMKSKGVTWDEKTLDQYLTDPKSFVPGNKMTFAGVKKADERHELIEYLATLKGG